MLKRCAEKRPLVRSEIRCLRTALFRVVFSPVKLEILEQEASKLPEAERATLASNLIRGLVTSVGDVSDEEVARRVKEGEDDPSVLISYEELVRGLKYRGA